MHVCDNTTRSTYVRIHSRDAVATAAAAAENTLGRNVLHTRYTGIERQREIEP